MKSVFAVAALAAIGFTGTAFAEDATKGWTTGAAVMSDSEMDRVTAGDAGGTANLGNSLAAGGGQTTAAAAHAANGAAPKGPNSPPSNKGLGQATEPGPAIKLP